MDLKAPLVIVCMAHDPRTVAKETALELDMPKAFREEEQSSIEVRDNEAYFIYWDDSCHHTHLFLQNTSTLDKQHRDSLRPGYCCIRPVSSPSTRTCQDDCIIFDPTLAGSPRSRNLPEQKKKMKSLTSMRYWECFVPTWFWKWPCIGLLCLHVSQGVAFISTTCDAGGRSLLT